MKKSKSFLLVLSVVTVATLFQGCAKTKYIAVAKNGKNSVYAARLFVARGWNDNGYQNLYKNIHRNLVLLMGLSKKYKGVAELELYNSSLKRRGGWDGYSLGNPDTFSFNGIKPIKCEWREKGQGVLLSGRNQWLTCEFKESQILKAVSKSNRYNIELHADDPRDLYRKTRYVIRNQFKMDKFRKVVDCYKKQDQTCGQETQKN